MGRLATNPAIGRRREIPMYCTRLKHLGLLKRLIRYTVVFFTVQSMIKKKKKWILLFFIELLLNFHLNELLDLNLLHNDNTL